MIVICRYALGAGGAGGRARPEGAAHTGARRGRGECKGPREGAPATRCARAHTAPGFVSFRSIVAVAASIYRPFVTTACEAAERHTTPSTWPLVAETTGAQPLDVDAKTGLLILMARTKILRKRYEQEKHLS